jgi:hypothetical protein
MLKETKITALMILELTLVPKFFHREIIKEETRKEMKIIIQI